MVVALMSISFAVSAQTSTTTGTPSPKPEVNQRLSNQNARINNGVANGKLTQGQANALHQDDRNIHREIRNDRAANGGKLTPAEKAKVNHQENRVSNQIYNQKNPSPTVK